ncbi:hypothetical protein V7S43_006962 [Phytophthora oleae]|uniref:Glutathione S-transferase n=1 Tax=Phytophthora oleae TaxID=2107226 RepID=A0ABD3FMY4_9STRA
MLFSYGGVKFVDERVQFPDFPALKPTLPFGQLPNLEVDGNIFAQSMAITRYAAKLAGLYPSDALDALKVDTFSCSLDELDEPYIDFKFKTQDEAEKEQKMKVFIEETVPKYFRILETLMDGKFTLGDNVSYVDVQLLDTVENKLKGEFPNFTLDAFPKLAALLSSLKAEPKIAASLSTL